MIHEVMVPCTCGNIEACRMELYVSDVRIAERDNVRLALLVEQLLEVAERRV